LRSEHRDGGHSTATDANAEVLVRVDGPVGIVSLNAPARRNALDAAMAHAFVAALTELAAAPTIGAVVVRGNGPSFCAGADVGVLRRVSADPAEAENFAEISAIYDAFFALGQCAVPTIAAARGTCVGAGVNLLLAADLRIVADDLRIVSGFARRGLHPGGGHLHLLARAGGREAAAAVALFDAELDGRRAVELGLAWEAVAADEVDARALTLARRAAASPELARTLVRNFRAEADSLRVDWQSAQDRERPAQMWSMRRNAPTSTH
jgi:enoyl-CoA hydratase